VNILVIGGLGYIGSDLCDRLRKFCTVSILDPDLYESAYKEHCSESMLIEQNLCTYEQGEQKYDCIVVCSEIDVEEFYDAEVYRGYLFAYSKALKALADNNLDTQIIYITTPPERMLVNHAKWSKQFVDHFSEHKRFTAIECPVLYGDNIVVRSDTLINGAVHDFMNYKAYMLSINPFSIIKFQHIFAFTQGVCDFITDGTAIKDVDCLQAIALVNAVQWSITGGDGFQLSISSEIAHTEYMEEGTVRLRKPDAFKAHLNMMINAHTQGMTNELFRGQSNRSVILQSALVGKKVNEKLNI